MLSAGGCKESAEKSQQKAIKLMTSQTLGLAYLEEFKLDEAEAEFQRYIKMAPKEKVGYANLGLTYLRMGKYPEAEEQLLKAIRIDPNDADIRLILATVYEMDNNREKAISVLNEALVVSPGHVKTLYSLSELYSAQNDARSREERRKCVVQLVERAPDNLVPHLSLIEILINDKEGDKAFEQLEIILKQFPEFPKEAVGFYKNTLDLLKKEDLENAAVQFAIFHNYMKVTSPYQAGILDLKGPGGNLIGFPVITYDQQMTTQKVDSEMLLDVIRFKEVGESARLMQVDTDPGAEYPDVKNLSHVVAGDYDGDGDTDVYMSLYDPASASFKRFLYNNEMGRFTDVAAEVGIDHTGAETSAVFVDYDNDGFLDLYIVREEGDLLYYNAEKGVFKNVTADANIGSAGGGNKALFFDLDHDGDLDLFEACDGENRVFRNNADGTFDDYTEHTGLAGKDETSTDAAFGDFDDDGDIDLVVVSRSGVALFSNQRQGEFREITAGSGLDEVKGINSVEVADYNNDGFLDLFFTSEEGKNTGLYKNMGDGSFSLMPGNKDLFAGLQNVKSYDSRIFDFDNDGFLDIVIAGEAGPGQRGLFLYHNEGIDEFKDVSSLLPETPNFGKQIALFDYNDDGDVDFLMAGVNGGVSLFRNDGGSMNHYVNVKLVGLRTGSAKNNHFGIGAKVEMRSGDLYQSMVVTEPRVHFGLGNRTMADVIRITWTNGVPQNIFKPGADQALIEAQTLKGSCPFLYTWNGEEYVFAKDITWRSALGMPLGIMGGTTQYGFADASDDYIKIPGEMLQPKDGKYLIQVTSELWETIYMDRIRLVAVDHPQEVDVFVPEQFTPPPFPGDELYVVKDRILPVAATDEKGNDVLELITEEDDKYVAGFVPDRFQGITEMHSLELDPGNISGDNNLFLFLNGWIFPTDASINVALSQSDALQVAAPVVQVVNNKGEWETVSTNISFPMGKDKNVVVDLSGKFLSDDHRVRIVTNMEIYWDYIFFAHPERDVPVVKTALDPESADLHYRGFSRSYRKGGRYGPHWFDYYDVNKTAQWRDLTGNYTRYGDVLPLLTKSDSKYIISNAGDETSIVFDASALPELPKGWKRDFLIHSVGWVKDGDMNTALGNTVEPLPFHGMKSYPPSESDVYPTGAEHQDYLKKYNTRKVTFENYRNEIKNGTFGETSMK